MVRVCLAGTWEPEFHRNRNLRRLLERAGCDVVTCQVDLWGSQRVALVKTGRLSLLLRALVAYPRLIWRFLRTPRPDVVIVPYPGHLDMVLLGPLCRARGIPVVFDIFISLFDTIVCDRELASRRSPLGFVTKQLDRLSCRLANIILADTPPHAEYFSELTGVPVDRFRVLWLGAQEEVFFPRPEVVPRPDLVVFFGTFVPLQGVETILRAAKELEGEGIEFRIIGDGQQRETADRLVRELNLEHVTLTGLVPLHEVPEEIARAAVCLGIFGTTPKADRVVPNKLFEALAVGRPVVTGDTAAIRAAFRPGEVVVVPPGDPQALAEGVLRLCRDGEFRETVAAAGHARFEEDFSQRRLATLLLGYLERLLDP